MLQLAPDNWDIDRIGQALETHAEAVAHELQKQSIALVTLAAAGATAGIIKKGRRVANIASAVVKGVIRTGGIAHAADTLLDHLTPDVIEEIMATAQHLKEVPTEPIPDDDFITEMEDPFTPEIRALADALSTAAILRFYRRGLSDAQEAPNDKGIPNARNASSNASEHQGIPRGE